jgi:hypothetical protein
MATEITRLETDRTTETDLSTLSLEALLSSF